MATRYGYQIGKYLVYKYGWSWHKDHDSERVGDPSLVDPQTNDILTPYTALDVQARRSKRCFALLDNGGIIETSQAIIMVFK